jgi:DNA-directed RNA polymerase sigma subunit (sigma70/sigma32)
VTTPHLLPTSRACQGNVALRGKKAAHREDGRVPDNRKTALRRVIAAHRRVVRAEGELNAARLERLEAMKAAREEGVTLAELADTIGVSRQRVAQLLED